MFKRIISITFLLTFVCTNAFAHTAVIENSGANKFKAVKLTSEIYNNSNRDLSDLRIKDDSGEEIPYSVNKLYDVMFETLTEEYPMSLIESYTKDDSFYFDYRVKDIPHRDIKSTSIELETNAVNFAKKIEVYGSYDNINWEFIQNDTLYSVDGNKKLSIEFEKEQKYTHFRFKLSNNLEKISFNSVTLTWNSTSEYYIQYTDSITPDFSIEEKDKTTYINLEGMKNLRLFSITIDTDSTFKRSVRSDFISKELYNLPFLNESYSDTTLSFEGSRHIPHDDVFTLTINNGDDKPIHINGVTVSYYVDELVFEDTESDKYILHFGADEKITAPVYDISNYIGEMLNSEIWFDRLEINEVSFDEIREEPKPYDYKTIFNIVIVVVSVVLGLLILMKLRKKA